ncbi:hypothetical protein H0H81_009503 [Sphagnurus paluster]|uniref:Uncharacterized protein n=1 Tax=Sphagnurus paluster TaxID=117069 RepID=A0A9P7KNW8_9AGAR|nr:hypothetical protein H0H81_009503 [Sphagnurus paluster]
MSEPADQSVPEVSEALGVNGHADGAEQFVGEHEEHDSGEESDEYDEAEVDVAEEEEEGDDDDDDEEYRDEEDAEKQASLTAMLLGNPNAVEEEEEEVDDEEYFEEAPAPVQTNGKKRSIADLAEAEDVSEPKKVKA